MRYQNASTQDTSSVLHSVHSVIYDYDDWQEDIPVNSTPLKVITPDKCRNIFECERELSAQIYEDGNVDHYTVTSNECLEMEALVENCTKDTEVNLMISLSRQTFYGMLHDLQEDEKCCKAHNWKNTAVDDLSSLCSTKESMGKYMNKREVFICAKRISRFDRKKTACCGKPSKV